MVARLQAFRRKGVLYLVFEHMDQSVMDLLEAKPNGVGAEIVPFIRQNRAKIEPK